MDRGSTILELSRSLVLPLTPVVTPITMEATLTMEEVHTTIVAPRMVMEEATDKTVPTHQCPPRKI